MKRIIIDLDNTICTSRNGDYADAKPVVEVIECLHRYRAMGFEIAIHTSRNMRTFGGNVGRINVVTLPLILDWLNCHDVPFDEVVVGKPWCGTDGFYVDDRAVRPAEFTRMTYEQICLMLEVDR